MNSEHPAEDAARLELLEQIEDLFDEYAPEFDEQLLSKLEYKVPALLCELLERHSPGRRWRRALGAGRHGLLLAGLVVLTVEAS